MRLMVPVSKPGIRWDFLTPILGAVEVLKFGFDTIEAV